METRILYPEGGGVYLITNTDNNKVYVGSTVDFRRRISTHKTRLKNGSHPNMMLQQSYDKHGVEAFVYSVLESVERDADKLIEAEQRYIDLYQSADNTKGYNLSPSAMKGCLGIKRSVEQGRNHSARMKGRKASPEVRALLLSYAKGRVVSEEQKQRLSQSRKGVTVKPETIAKMMQSEYHRTASERLGREYIITSPSGEVFDMKNLKVFCQEHGLVAKRMVDVASGRKNVWKGWKCQRKANYSKEVANFIPRAIHKDGYLVGLKGQEPVLIYNMSVFCQENGLKSSAMFDVASGRKKSHKGWVCKRKED